MAPHREQYKRVTRQPSLTSKTIFLSVTHLWKLCRHNVLPLCFAPGLGFLNVKMSAIRYYGVSTWQVQAGLVGESMLVYQAC